MRTPDEIQKDIDDMLYFMSRLEEELYEARQSVEKLRQELMEAQQ